MSRRTRKPEVINLRELPIVAASGGIRIEYACTGGCLVGYMWSPGGAELDEHLRELSRVLKQAHDLRHTSLEEIT